MLSGCGSSSQQKNGLGTTSNEGKPETAASGSYTVTDLTGTKVTFNTKPKNAYKYLLLTTHKVHSFLTSFNSLSFDI